MLTVKVGRATLTSPGGIQTSLRPVEPGVYEEETDLGALQIKVVADLNDRTLTVSDKCIGCWWDGDELDVLLDMRRSSH